MIDQVKCDRGEAFNFKEYRREKDRVVSLGDNRQTM